MLPAQYNLQLYRGDTVRMRLRMWLDKDKTQPADLTGVIAASQIRDKPDGNKVTDMECTVTLPNIVDTVLTSDDSYTTPLKGVWDLRLEFPGGDVQTPIGGTVSVKPDVTRTSDRGR